MAKLKTTQNPLKVVCEFDEIEYFYLLHLLNCDISETRMCLKRVKENPQEAHLAAGIEEGMQEIIDFYESINIFNLPLDDVDL